MKSAISESERTKSPEEPEALAWEEMDPLFRQQLQTTAPGSQEELEDAATASLAFGFSLPLLYIPVLPLPFFPGISK